MLDWRKAQQGEQTYSATYVRRLVRLNWLWGTLVVGLALISAAKWELNRIWTDLERIHVIRQEDGGVTFSSSSDGPFVVTHLVYKHWYVARLPEPVVMLESGRSTVSRAVVKKLIWRETREGSKVALPPQDAPLAIFYYKAQRTELESGET